MSWLSKAVGKIPVVGHALNQAGKVLPSTGQMIGGIGGPIGTILGGSIDPYTSSLQKKIGNTIAGTELGVGLGGALLPALAPIAGAAGAALPGIVKGAAGALPGIVKKGAGLISGGGAGGINLGNLADIGLGTAGLVNASQLAGKSDQYAQNAYNGVNDDWKARQSLRERGILGLQDPHAGVPLAMQNVKNNLGTANPFFKKPVVGAPL